MPRYVLHINACSAGPPYKSPPTYSEASATRIKTACCSREIMFNRYFGNNTVNVIGYGIRPFAHPACTGIAKIDPLLRAAIARNGKLTSRFRRIPFATRGTIAYMRPIKHIKEYAVKGKGLKNFVYLAVNKAPLFRQQRPERLFLLFSRQDFPFFSSIRHSL